MGMHPDIRSGELIAHRLFDVADEIDLARAEAAWLAHAGREGKRARLSTASANELSFEVPPTELTLPPSTVDLDGVALPATMSARVYDFGAIAIALRVEANDLSWGAFVDRCNALDRALASEAAASIWRGALRS